MQKLSRIKHTPHILTLSVQLKTTLTDIHSTIPPSLSLLFIFVQSLYDLNVSMSFDHILKRKKLVTIERQKDVSTMRFYYKCYSVINSAQFYSLSRNRI